MHTNHTSALALALMSCAHAIQITDRALQAQLERLRSVRSLQPTYERAVALTAQPLE